MNVLFIAIYLVCFCLIAGGAAGLMYANIKSIWNTPPAPPKPIHPEAPKEGEEVMYVDLTRDKLENLYHEH